MPRALISFLLFSFLVVSSLRGSFYRLLIPPHRFPPRSANPGGIDREPLREKNDPIPIEMLSFFEGVRDRTQTGESIAIVLSPPYDNFSYAYWRSVYMLAGRRASLPLGPGTSREKNEADWVVTWGRVGAPEGWMLIWTSHEGSLWRKEPLPISNRDG